IHVRQGDSIALWRPASGLVTAMEPIMRACSGTWIAHGGGSADREVVDEHARVAVPPEQPAYELRRVWRTSDQEAGYYYGFASDLTVACDRAPSASPRCFTATSSSAPSPVCWKPGSTGRCSLSPTAAS